MATFRASKRFHFSEDGTNPWAVFELVGSDPAVYEFDTADTKVIARLERVDGVTRVDEPKKRAPRKAASEPDGDGGDEESPPKPEAEDE